MSGVDSAVEREEGGRGKPRHAARKCGMVPHPCSRPPGNFLDDVTGLTFAVVTKVKRLMAARRRRSLQAVRAGGQRHPPGVVTLSKPERPRMKSPTRISAHRYWRCSVCSTTNMASRAPPLGWKRLDYHSERNRPMTPVSLKEALQ
jgi:hypothetical protein